MDDDWFRRFGNYRPPAQPVVAKVLVFPEWRHFGLCKVCNGRFNRFDRVQVAHHRQPGHPPMRDPEWDRVKPLENPVLLQGGFPCP